ncbi:HAMP domain-containing sensor histidine kinase [Rhizobium sp. RM]|uniref:sensor histidine kinase n=1 Tax=Rhizobium sp. RM TaxID=2748079 RepID=UPI00110D9479|nr:HAMP domain-containing sensor histidine kinase [Rhizobium sp. RM]NWJ27715.1 HAMP domain-containing histidine kinase [Rhizobium sp. RM]TMV21878.1 HAMP domain-containing histidine kinase [Rhizobium sp. Td3]
MTEGLPKRGPEGRPLSIRVRFLLVSLVTVPLALSLASLFMISLFKANLERRLDAELSGHLNNIAASLQFSAEGHVERPSGFFDKRFTEAYGGLYWQISEGGASTAMRSQSLWDFTLAVPVETAGDGSVQRFSIPGPDNTMLTAQQRQIFVPSPGGLRSLLITVAADRQPLEDASRRFSFDILPYIAGLAIFLIGASVAQVVFGLKPLATLTTRLDRIRERRSGRLDGVLPVEFEPVEKAVDRLLDVQAQSLAKARARAGDLAHGLKTPLTVLANDALTLRQKGESEIADEIERLVILMRGHVDAELARSRIVIDAEMRQSDADIGKIVGQVVRTLKRTPAGETLDWRISVEESSVEVPVDPHDLRELIGNILENAVKWASATVVVAWSDRRLTVADDGPGVPPDRIRQMTERGVRLDTDVPGSGFGLSIVKEICSVYGLTLSIENCQGSGLQVTVGF